MKKLILLAALLLLANCKTTGNEYTASTGNNDKMSIDVAECEMKANEARTTAGLGGLAGVSSYISSYNNQFDACMRSKGYTKDESTSDITKQ